MQFLQSRPWTSHRRLSVPCRQLLVAYAVSAVGSGMIYPLTALYLVKARELGPNGAGVYFAMVAVAAIVMAPFGGRVADSIGARNASSAGVALQALGYLALAFAPNLLTVGGAALLVGCGNGVFYPSLTPLISSVTSPEERPRAFSMRYLAMNVGIGVGAPVGGFLAHAASGVRGYQAAYVANSLSYLVLLFMIRAGTPRGTVEATGVQKTFAGYRSVFADRNFVLLLVTHTVLVLFGYSQFDSAVPLLFNDKLLLSTTVIGALIAVNTVGVVILQPLVTGLTEGRREASVLSWVGIAWSIAFALAGIGSLAPDTWGLALLVCFSLVFAVGECSYAASFHPLVTRMSPAASLGRYSALVSLSWNLGSMTGPFLGINAVQLLPVTGYWSLYAVAAVSVALLAGRLAGRLSVVAEVPPADRVPGGT